MTTHLSEFVMPGLVPGIHVFLAIIRGRRKTWMTGTSPVKAVLVRPAIIYGGRRKTWMTGTSPVKAVLGVNSDGPSRRLPEPGLADLARRFPMTG